jgi:uncharacterized protein YjiS (DUF1127 family)
LSGGLPHQVTANNGGAVDAPPASPGESVMTEKSLRREHRQSSLVHRLDGHRRPGRLAGMVYTSSVLSFDRAPLPLWTSPETPLAKWLPPRAGTGRVAPLAALHRIAVALRLRRERDRSRQQLRELNDHLLKDIGLRREDLGFEAPKPPWRRD